MTPYRIQERLEESDDSVDTEAFVEALQYVRDDPRKERSSLRGSSRSG